MARARHAIDEINSQSRNHNAGTGASSFCALNNDGSLGVANGFCRSVLAAARRYLQAIAHTFHRNELLPVGRIKIAQIRLQQYEKNS
jgi:hypothetical protein